MDTPAGLLYDARVSNPDLVILLFLQLCVILAPRHPVARVGRWARATRVGRAQTARVLCRASVLGVIAPWVQEWLFPIRATLDVAGTSVTIPHPSMSILYALSQLGLVLYMFLVGLEFNVGLMSGRVRSAGLVSSAGI